MGVNKITPNDTTTVLPDILRQRVAFALSQIFVVSDRPRRSRCSRADWRITTTCC